ncbi:MAG: VanW family protein [Chloroflexota bacterium]
MGALLAFIVIAPLALYQVLYTDLVHPGLLSLGLNLSGYSEGEAKRALTAEFAKYALDDVVLRYGGEEWRQTPGALGLRFDVDNTVREAMSHGRTGTPLRRLVDLISAWRDGRPTAPVLTVDEARAAAVVRDLARAIDRPTVNASMLIRSGGVVEVSPAQVGRKVDTAETLKRLRQSLLSLSSGPSEIAVDEVPPRVLEAQLAAARETALRLVGAPLTVVYGREATKLDTQQLTAMLIFREEGGKTVAELDEVALADVVQTIAKRIDKQPQDARFRFKDGKVQLVAESVEGASVEVGPSVQSIREAALGEVRIVPLVVTKLPPNYPSSAIGQIVIREKIVEAETVYGDTGADRQHNVRLAVSRLDGVLIPPGGTFSFNQSLSTTRLMDGYKMGWGIINTKDGPETVPSEAGGICQVSTTLFHAAFWAGLRIDQRTEHLYWIPRYGKPPLGRTGLDSTVDGSGSPDTLDFKFTNNTPNWLAIGGRWDDKNIYFALYGTKPTWTVEVGEPVISNIVKTDPELVRTYDADLKPGEEVWVESAQDGFDVVIKRVVREGNRIADELLVGSMYRPARNVVRYGPPLPTPTPAPQPEATAQPAPTVVPTGPAPKATPSATPGQGR